ncbi:hypothetical protein ANAEL_05618 [Anaerolineales bacterium]|nr:hypothetical protein ANAEL_05618 [Anaerolineales bacterium]
MRWGIKNLFTNSDPTVNPGCTEFEVDKMAISRFILDVLVPVVGVSPFPLDEQMLMVAAMCRFKPTHLFAWGTKIGKSARIFHETNRRFGIGAEIHSIDLPDEIGHVEHPGRSRGKLVKGFPEVKLHQGDGLDVAMKIFRTAGLASRPLFFLDGDHAYESVRRELETILREVPNPAILVHDTFFQSSGSGYNVGPFSAIQDSLPSDADHIGIIHMNLGLPGMSCIYRR